MVRRDDANVGGPLAGLRVLDAASLYAAPLLASLLADQGADVVKLEPPGGDAYRATGFWPLVARGKRSVVLDLADAGERAALRGLVAAAHVVVVNEPAARLATRGLDPDTMLAVNPGLVVAHVSGYGADGPAAGRPGNGTMGEAFAGLTHMTGDADGPPMLPSVPLGDAVMAYAGAFGVAAACHDVRVNGGPGRVVDVNPVEAMLHVVGPTLVSAAAGVAAGAAPPGRLGGGLAGSALRDVFACADGGWLAVSVSTPRQLRDLAAVVGAPAGTAGGELGEAVRTWAGGLDRAEAVERLAAARLPGAPVNTAHDVVTDPHLRHRQALRTLRTPEGATVTVPAPSPRTAHDPATGGAPQAGVLPKAGQHTGEVLREWAAPTHGPATHGPATHGPAPHEPGAQEPAASAK
ncbi:putative acyl-CoA transferase/carnitine dehydratase [Frankia torreyi]|uniref:Putative acyl-CoA transferase/carnitine dehydratase n=1 Tax=Frankia torreyi TaxID=1856 RepID=A0A0D8BE20_9ACTN|nr:MULTISPECIES: CoA transferase [Frankia]KJE22523.1 putative acyl-CoA transferase/carnitine dehydratase [Frankia torreyi]KQM04562.1 putative acyl-CoA transferase/carnitine dehydratase [Frankia sp. CpI1-P]